MSKLAAIFSTATAASAYRLNDATLPFIGVSLTALLMAAAGAVLSFAFSDSTGIARRKMFFVAMASTIAGASCVTVVPELIGLEISKVAQPPLAFILSLFMPWLIPALKGVLPAFGSALANALGTALGNRANPNGGMPPPYYGPPGPGQQPPTQDPNDNGY